MNSDNEKLEMMILLFRCGYFHHPRFRVSRRGLPASWWRVFGALKCWIVPGYARRMLEYMEEVHASEMRQQLIKEGRAQELIEH